MENPNLIPRDRFAHGFAPLDRFIVKAEFTACARCNSVIEVHKVIQCVGA